MSNNLMLFAKMTVDQGRSPGLDKSVFGTAIEKLAEGIRRDGETPEKAYTRAITEIDDGRLLFKALKIAPAAAPVFPAGVDAPQDYAHGNPKDEAVRAILEGAKRVQAEAKTKSVTLSDAQAFDRFYNAPENAKAKAAYDRSVALWRVKTPQ